MSEPVVAAGQTVLGALLCECGVALTLAHAERVSSLASRSAGDVAEELDEASSAIILALSGLATKHANAFPEVEIVALRCFRDLATLAPNAFSLSNARHVMGTVEQLGRRHLAVLGVHSADVEGGAAREASLGVAARRLLSDDQDLASLATSGNMRMGSRLPKRGGSGLPDGSDHGEAADVGWGGGVGLDAEEVAKRAWRREAICAGLDCLAAWAVNDEGRQVTRLEDDDPASVSQSPGPRV